MEEQRQRFVGEYEKLKQQHSLPELAEVELVLGREFQDFPVPVVLLYGLAERINQMANHIESLFQPRTLSDNIESSYYNKEEKDKLFSFYKYLVMVLHENLVIVLSEDAGQQLSQFKKLFDLYKTKVKPEYIVFISDQAEKWKADEEVQQEDRGSYIS